VANSQKLREQISAEVAKAQAIVALAEQENRDLSAEEKTSIDQITGETGIVDQLQKDLERQIRLEAKAKEILNVRPVVHDQKPEVKIPASAKRHSKLKAFKSDVDAYAAGQFIRAVTVGAPDAKQWCSDHGIGIQAAHSESSNTAGGYLVPDVMENAIINLREEYGVARSALRVWPMSSMSLNIPRRQSGFTSYFVGENSAGTESDMSFSQVRLDAKKLMILTRLSSELNADSIISLADLVANEMALQIANKEDECTFNGDGTSTYGGIVGLKSALAAGAVYTFGTGEDVFADLTTASFTSAMGKLPRFPGIRPAWYIHSAGYFASMARLLAAAGGNTVQILENGVSQVQFMGYPVIFTQVLTSALTSTASTIFGYFGDLSMAAAMGSRSGIEIVSDSSRYFEFDQVAIRATTRFDVVVHETGTASACGPVVALKFAA
jgi:HK97 family phage major capsid protein